MKQKVVRVGLIGYGYAGKTFHAPSIQAVDGMELTVLGSSQGEVLPEIFPNTMICPADEVPRHKGIDLVVIATPNDSHYPLAKAALLAGKDVVLDKPFTVTLEEARSLKKIAEEAGRLLSVFHNRRWESEVKAAKEILSSGELGRVSYFECRMDRFRPNVRKRWREEPGPGAGLWYDLGPHLIDLSLYLFGLPREVVGNFAILREGGLTDDWAHVQMVYDHMRIILNATLVSAGGAPRALMHGTKGSWAKYGQDVQEDQLKAGMSPRDPAFGIDPSMCVVYDGETGAKREIPSPRGNQKEYYEEVRDALIHGTALPVTARDAVATMAILEASFASDQEGRRLPIPLTEAEKAEWA